MSRVLNTTHCTEEEDMSVVSLMNVLNLLFTLLSAMREKSRQSQHQMFRNPFFKQYTDTVSLQLIVTQY